MNKLVKRIQIFLKQHGLYNGVADGQDDSETRHGYDLWCRSVGKNSPTQRAFPEHDSFIPEEITKFFESRKKAKENKIPVVTPQDKNDSTEKPLTLETLVDRLKEGNFVFNGDDLKALFTLPFLPYVDHITKVEDLENGQVGTCFGKSIYTENVDLLKELHASFEADITKSLKEIEDSKQKTEKPKSSTETKKPSVQIKKGGIPKNKSSKKK